VTRWSKVLTTQDSHDDARRIDDAWQRVRARRARPRFVRRAMVAVPILALAAVIVLFVRGWLAPAQPLASVVPAAALAPIALAGGSALPTAWTADSPAPLVVPLDDGSRLELAPQAHVKTGKGAPDRVELALESGRATFDVKPNGPRAWVIDVGPVVVKVLGTRFTVARSGNVVEVTVERGKVQVTGEGLTRVLGAGEGFTSGMKDANANANVDPKADAEATANADADARVKADEKAKTVAATPVRARALAPASASALASDPMTRADTLRRSGKSSDAVAVLREVVDAARDGRAPLAAFTIGKIHAEDLRDPAGAAPWFERAITLGLPSGLDEEAQARAVECFARAGSRADTARAAKRYEARFPEGRHLARVKEWSSD
jgi:transmembrane sensor